MTVATSSEIGQARLGTTVAKPIVVLGASAKQAGKGITIDPKLFITLPPQD